MHKVHRAILKHESSTVTPPTLNQCSVYSSLFCDAKTSFVRLDMDDGIVFPTILAYKMSKS